MATKGLFTNFAGGFVPGLQSDGTTWSGTAGETNTCIIDGNPWEYFVMGTQTILSPVYATGANPGLDCGQDQTASDGCILTPFSNNKNSPLAFTIGTAPAFYCQVSVKVADWSGCVPFVVGFHATAAATNPLQAHTATFADYTDKATIGVSAGGGTTGDIQIVTALNNAADVTTDTTDNAADGTTVVTFRVNVSGAGVVTYRHDNATQGTMAAPTTVAAYTFDTGDIAHPMIYFLHGADVAGAVELMEFRCGHQ